MKLPKQTSDAIRRLNPQIFGGGVGRLESPQRKSDSGETLGRKAPGKKPGRSRVVKRLPTVRVTLVGFQNRIYDSDNFISGCKPLRDAIAEWLGTDDADSGIAWEYGQQLTHGTEGVVVKIERINNS